MPELEPVASVQHKRRDKWGGRWAEGGVADVRSAYRGLTRAPYHALSAMAMLAIGIGATTALFAVLYTVLLRPLPYPEPDRIVQLFQHRASAAGAGTIRTSAFSVQQFDEWRAAARTLSAMALFGMRIGTISRNSRAVRLWGSVVSRDFFAVMRVAPLLGRTFERGAGSPQREPVIVLGYAAWTTYFGADDGIVGDVVRMDGDEYRVIGVMPADFLYPRLLASYRSGSGQREDGSEFWILRSGAAGQADGDIASGGIVGRVASDVSMQEADAEARAVLAQLTAGREARAELMPLHEQVTAPVRPALVFLFGAGLVVLAAAITNVMGLVLGRAERRRGDVYIRRALGAGWGTLVRYELTESLMIAGGGAAGGWVIALTVTGTLASLGGGVLPRIAELRVDGPVVLFMGVAGLFCALVCGFTPVLYWAVADRKARRGGASVGVPRQFSTRAFRAVAGAEVGLATLLLVAAVLVVVSLARLAWVDPGFDSRGVLTLTVPLPEIRYPTDGQRLVVAERIRESFESVAGVERVALSNSLPFQMLRVICCFGIEGRPAEPSPAAASRYVAPGYFRAMGISVLKGRAFVESDRTRQPSVAIVSDAFVRRYLNERDPFGVRLELNGGEFTEIVGVVSSARHRLDRVALPELFRPYGQEGGDAGAAEAPTYGLRTRGNAIAMVPQIRRAVADIDGSLSIEDVATLEQRLKDSIGRNRVQAFVLGSFGMVALLLATGGISGVLVYLVGRRIREIGIRVALGADRGAILRMVYRQGLTMAVGGVGVGLAGAAVLARYMESLLWSTSAREPWVYGGVALVLTGVACVACFVPARRAVQISPVAALRME